MDLSTNCWGTPCNEHHPPREVAVDTTLPLTGGEHARGHVQPEDRGKYPGPISAAPGCACAGTLIPQSRLCQGKAGEGNSSTGASVPRGSGDVPTPRGMVFLAAKWWHFQRSSALQEHKRFSRTPDDSIDKYLQARACSTRFHRSGSVHR